MIGNLTEWNGRGSHRGWARRVGMTCVMLLAVSAPAPGELEPGIAVKEKIDCGGRAMIFDSYHSDEGPYTAATAGAEVVATVNATGSNKLVLYSNAVLNGDGYIGPGGDPDRGIQTWSGAHITGSRGALGAAIEFPNLSAPTGSPFDGSHEGNLQLFGSQTATITSDRYFNKLQLWGSSTLRIVGEVTILLNNKLEMSSGTALEVAPGSRLLLYVRGACDIGGRLNAGGGPPSQCYVLMLGNSSFGMWGSAEAHAVVNNPNGKVAIWGTSEFYGLIKAKRFEGGRPVHIDLDASFDFEESLADEPLFTDVTDAAELDGITNTYGHAWGDYNNDGYPDLYVTGTDRLYRNEGDGTFARGPSVSASDRAAHWGDYDNDGDLDIGTTWNLYLSRNEGNERFRREHNSSVGITSINNLGDFAWLDYNGDGRLDLWAPNGSQPYASMYRGGGGMFSAIAGCDIGLSANTNGESTIVGDYDGDGEIDILYRAGRAYLWRNNGDGTFTETTSSAGISLRGTSGGYDGTAFGDYDNDGDLDLYGAQSGSNKLYRNNGNGTFTDVTAAAGVAGPSATSKGVMWADYDNDGDLDLYVAQENAANSLYENNGDGTFTDVAEDAGVADASASYGVTWEDYDLDGDLDLFVGNSSGRSRLYRNNTDSTNALRVRVIGGGTCQTNRAGVGVRVDVYDETGQALVGRRTIGVASGFGCSESMWAHFGGVTVSERYEVKVYFVDGEESVVMRPVETSTTIGGTVIGQMVTVEEPAQSVAYADVSEETGFNVRSTTSYHDGSGLHWADFDNDGDLDAIITGNSSARLMLNIGGGASFFAGSLGTSNLARQGVLLDLNNDGDVDFWHVNEVYFDNDGSGSFTNYGSLGFTDPKNSEGAAAADVNGDGWCDIVAFSDNGNWIGFSPGSGALVLSGTRDSAYGLNDRGDQGNGDFCSSGDVNNDGRLDFFYNYGNGKLFVSDGDGTFTQDNRGISVVTGNHDKMGTAWGDYDNDGDLDLYVPRYDSGRTGYLWRNDGSSFTNVTSLAGITDTSGQRSCCWGDYDNDGDLDLYIVTHSGASNVLYENLGNGTFASGCAGVEAPGNGHDAVFVDYDNDGDLDLAITQEDTGNTLLRNDTDRVDYLKVRVIGAGAGATDTAAIGARIELYTEGGASLLGRRDIGVARGFGGTEPLWAHFGGVTATETYMVKVYFRSGVQSVGVVPEAVSTTIGTTTIAQMLTIEEPAVSEEMQVVEWVEVDPGE